MISLIYEFKIRYKEEKKMKTIKDILIMMKIYSKQGDLMQEFDRKMDSVICNPSDLRSWFELINFLRRHGRYAEKLIQIIRYELHLKDEKNNESKELTNDVFDENKK